MSFASKFRQLISELDLSQAQVAAMTGIGASSISQYLSGRNEPYKERQKEIARALGVQEDYFRELLPEAIVQESSVINVPVSLAAKLMRKSKPWVEQGLQDGRFPWGYAVKRKKWSYWISSVKFTEYTGIEVPINQIEVTECE